MTTRTAVLALVATLAAAGSVAGIRSASPAEASAPSSASRHAARTAPARPPLAFEESLGQTDGRVRFLARCSGMTAFLLREETVFALHAGGDDADDGVRTAVLRMKFLGGSADPALRGVRPTAGRSHYLRGAEPSRWVTGVRAFEAVEVAGVYPGVDARWSGGSDRRLRYDLIVAAGADPAPIAFRLEGATGLGVTPDGRLVASTATGELAQDRPVAFQTIGGVRREVDAAFSVRGDVVGFELGVYDRSHELVVDPGFTWSATVGGTAFERGSGIAVDGAGSAYVTGYTLSVDFPVSASAVQSAFGGGTGSARDAFVTKLHPAGTATVFSTYLGGSGNDEGWGIAVGDSGAAYVCGTTASPNFPAVSAYQAAAGGASDGFVVKLAPDGASFAYATYLGGSGLEPATRAIAIDADGAAYVTGSTASSDFPVTQSAFQTTYGGTGSTGLGDVFVAKLGASGSTLTWSTYVGGTGGDSGTGIAVDSTGRVLVAGLSDSTNFPTQSPVNGFNAGRVDGVVFRLNASGSSLDYSTYYGGSGYDWFGDVAVDSTGAAYLAGRLNNVTALALKLNASGSAVVYTYQFGDAATNSGAYSIAVDSGRSAVISGYTGWTGFPSTEQPGMGGGGLDAFAAKLSVDGTTFVNSTFIGGPGPDLAWAVALDAAGTPYVTGSNQSEGSPAGDAFVVKLPWSASAPPAEPSAPSAPIGLAADYSPVSGVTLSWQDGSGDETGFRVERSPAGYAFSHLVSTPADVVGHVDALLYPSTTYSYRVRAFNAHGDSAWSNVASITTAGGGSVPAPPKAPMTLTATAEAGAGIALVWGDGSSDEVAFDVERASGGDRFRTRLRTVPDVARVVDSDVHPGWPASYRVRALSLQGASPWSNTATAAIPATMELAATKGTIVDSRMSGRDRIRVSGTFALPAAPPGEVAFDPVENGLDLQVGPSGAAVSVTVPAGDPAWKVRREKLSWKSAKGVEPAVSLVIDTRRRTFSATVSRLSLGGTPAPSVHVLVASGAAGGAHLAVWTERRPGVLQLK